MSHLLYFKVKMFNLKFREYYTGIFCCLSFKTVKLFSELLLFRIQSPFLQRMTLNPYSYPYDLAFGCTKTHVFSSEPELTSYTNCPVKLT